MDLSGCHHSRLDLLYGVAFTRADASCDRRADAEAEQVERVRALLVEQGDDPDVVAAAWIEVDPDPVGEAEHELTLAWVERLARQCVQRVEALAARQARHLRDRIHLTEARSTAETRVRRRLALRASARDAATAGITLISAPPRGPNGRPVPRTPDGMPALLN